MAEVERFWCARGEQSLRDSDSFLTNPDQLILDRFSSNPQAIPTTELRNRRAVVMLGEMGIGKSTVLRRPELVVPPAIKVLRIDLAPYGSELRLSDEVVRHRSIKQWIAGSTELALVLDGFDEAQERIPQLGQILASAISAWPTERLLLRIASRTLDWSRILERTIEDSFDDSCVVALMPLRREDARAIAAELCNDPEAFLTAVDSSGSAVFASRPQTLRMLATSFQSYGTLPERAADVYDRGTRWLAEEVNEGRIESKLAGTLTIDERIAVARRVAAGLTFGRSAAVRTHREGAIGSEDLLISAIAQGDEPAQGSSISVTESAVKEILSSGLFAAQGLGRLGFAHASFGDYLTAAWMEANNLSDDKVRSLLIGPDRRVRSQLRGAAAWLVAIAPDRFNWLAADDPESFLGQVDLPSADLRARVIEGLFAIADHRDWSWSDQLGGLNHPGVAEQIRPRLTNGSDDQRRLAIKLARDCQIVEVRPGLASIALDSALDDGLRSRAGYAAISFDSSAPSADFAPLALDESIRGADDTDELLAIGLTASWPHVIKTPEVLGLVHTPKLRDLFGGYRRFIDDLARGLRPEDIGPAISWLEAHIDEIESGGFEELADAIIGLVGKVDIDADIQASLGRIAVVRAGNYKGILFSRRLYRRNNEVVDTDSRRRIANAIIGHTTTDTVILYISDRPAGGSGLLRPDDLEWIVAEATKATGPRLAALDRLFGLTFVVDRRDHVDLFLELDEEHPLRTSRRDWVQVDRESDTAAEMKRMHELMNPHHLYESHQPEADVEGRLLELLARTESGEPQAFVELGRVLATTELEFDLTATPTWRILDSEARHRIVSAAHAYLNTKSCDPDAWVDHPSTLNLAAYGGYRALTLLLRVRPAALEQLSTADWVEWAPMIATMTRRSTGQRGRTKLNSFAVQTCTLTTS